MTWVGIDVGGRRKGFHLCAVSEDLTVELAHVQHPSHASEMATQWVGNRDPWCVAIDNPAAWAPPTERSRPCEREFARAGICGIRYTPSAEAAGMRTDTHYEWIEHGLELWAELRARGVEVIECFPTASWTQWCGAREGSRAAWTRRGLARLMPSPPGARNQDERDSVAAALTARQAERRPKSVVRFEALVVPAAGTSPVENP